MDDLRLADGIAKQAAVAIELHRTQRHIIEQERLNAVGKMASGLAHDFNNALVPISGYAEMLLEHPEILQDAPKSTRYLKLIMTGVEDAASVVSRLREFYQFNCDLLGEASPAADAELLAVLIDSFRAFALTEADFVVRLSSRTAWQQFFAAAARKGV